MGKKRRVVKEPDEIVVTHFILADFIDWLATDSGVRFPEKAALALMRQRTGKRVRLVAEYPASSPDDRTVLIGLRRRVRPTDRTSVCAECGCTVFHSAPPPPDGDVVCAECGPFPWLVGPTRH